MKEIKRPNGRQHARLMQQVCCKWRRRQKRVLDKLSLHPLGSARGHLLKLDVCLSCLTQMADASWSSSNLNFFLDVVETPGKPSAFMQEGPVSTDWDDNAPVSIRSTGWNTDLPHVTRLFSNALHKCVPCWLIVLGVILFPKGCNHEPIGKCVPFKIAFHPVPGFCLSISLILSKTTSKYRVKRSHKVWRMFSSTSFVPMQQQGHCSLQEQCPGCCSPKHSMSRMQLLKIVPETREYGFLPRSMRFQQSMQDVHARIGDEERKPIPHSKNRDVHGSLQMRLLHWKRQPKLFRHDLMTISFRVCWIATCHSQQPTWFFCRLCAYIRNEVPSCRYGRGVRGLGQAYRDV